jgi:SAM-dependent methyltransferase
LKHHDFLNPVCSATTLDVFGDRRHLLDALVEQLERFHGTILDIGCGESPYKSLILASPSRVEEYIGLDLNNDYGSPDIYWDGQTIPLGDSSVDCAMATEVFEHCPDIEAVLGETMRVLRPGGLLFFTVPFLWPLHNSPHDEYRYTPFALERHLCNAGFERIALQSLGGWDASLAQMIGLWVRRRPMHGRLRQFLSLLLAPLVGYLFRRDSPPPVATDQTMITGIAGTAVKPILHCRC